MRARQLAAAIVFCAATAHADEPASGATAVREALACCEAADDVPVADRMPVLSHGLRRAEDAVEIDPRDAAAHFAMFCNLGKRAQMRRQAMGVTAMLVDLARARREIDEALKLSPSYPDALAAKGQMLIELPRLLGGDRVEGERLLRVAVGLVPDDARMRVMLATSLAADGEREEALEHATVAIDLLEHGGRERELALARSLAAHLR
jgi:tetratricopeptide (TPR) repeat protein